MRIGYMHVYLCTFIAVYSGLTSYGCTNTCTYNTCRFHPDGVSVLARVLTTCINRCLNPITLYGCFWFQFICQFCYKPYGSKQNMVFHLRAVHGVGGDPPRCKTCGRADFKSQAALCQHSKKCQKAGK